MMQREGVDCISANPVAVRSVRAPISSNECELVNAVLGSGGRLRGADKPVEDSRGRFIG